MGAELLPCPFCGGEAEIHPSDDWDVRFTGATFFAWCDKCETRGDYYSTEAEAIAAWNSRPPIEYDGWFYLPKPKEELVVYSEPEITRTDNGYKVRHIVDVVDEAARKWGEELDEYIMRRICEIWNPERTCRIVKASRKFYIVETYDELLEGPYVEPTCYANKEDAIRRVKSQTYTDSDGIEHWANWRELKVVGE